MSHRVHYGSNPEYIDKNYGNLFIVWDRMFGTFAPERAPVIYGLRTNVDTLNPFLITIETPRTTHARRREF
jgi:sterol desaturase/sphingolipid hydroxylase (fatty acid hydroxylase superfamily)